jgi:glycosyltransferase involved in cell wall biosynthesis
MRILLVHNSYQQPGGEDQVFAAESELLEQHGHTVLQYRAHNDQITELGRATLARKTLWNDSVYRELRSICRDQRPQVVHFHNTFPLISPAAYYAARAERVAVVQTLHNYRLLCPGTTFYRGGRVCEDCMGRLIPWPGVLHACYRESRSASTGVAALVIAHRLARTWTRAVDLYIVLTEFARQKFIEGGIPATKLVRKPNFLPADPGVGEHRGGFALFVGRLSPEKGLHSLLEGWATLGERIPLRVVGDGPLASLLRTPASGVEWLGQRRPEEVVRLMQDASFLIVPSECYETFGLVIIEAFATGLPVIVSDIGAPAEIVEQGRTGLHFRAGDAGDLRAKVVWAAEHPAEMAEMGKQARSEYLERYTTAPNHSVLMEIYEAAQQARSTKRPLSRSR